MYFIYIIQSFPSSIHPSCSFSSVYHSFYSQHPLTTLIPARYIIQPSTIHPFTAFSQLHLAPFIHAIAIHPSTILLTQHSVFSYSIHPSCSCSSVYHSFYWLTAFSLFTTIFNPFCSYSSVYYLFYSQYLVFSFQPHQ